MRATVTLDPDVERLLREAMHRSRLSFKETLNRALRTALGREPARSSRPAFILAARPLVLRAGIDPTSFNKLAESLLVEKSTIGLGTRLAGRFSDVGGVDLPEVARSHPRREV